MASREINLKIYVENGDTLVLEGQGHEDRDGYFPTRWDDTVKRIGTVVLGKKNITITDEAKKAIKRIVLEANRTGDDISCLDITPAGDSDVCVSYIGDVVTKINIEEAISGKSGFFIGCGEGAPDVKLLDKLTLVDSFRTHKAVEVAADYWVDRARRCLDDHDNERLEIFRSELLKNLGFPRSTCPSELEGGCWGYDDDGRDIVKEALDAALLPHFVSGVFVSVHIVPWFGNPEKRTVRAYEGRGSRGRDLADVVEEY